MMEDSELEPELVVVDNDEGWPEMAKSRGSHHVYSHFRTLARNSHAYA